MGSPFFNCWFQIVFYVNWLKLVYNLLFLSQAAKYWNNTAMIRNTVVYLLLALHVERKIAVRDLLAFSLFYCTYFVLQCFFCFVAHSTAFYLNTYSCHVFVSLKSSAKKNQWKMSLVRAKASRNEKVIIQIRKMKTRIYGQSFVSYGKLDFLG